MGQSKTWDIFDMSEMSGEVVKGSTFWKSIEKHYIEMTSL